MYKKVKEIRLSAINIPQTRTSSSIEYFVDVVCKDDITNTTVVINHRVFKRKLLAKSEAYRPAREYKVLVINTID